jgi:hypothetical protein
VERASWSWCAAQRGPTAQRPFRQTLLVRGWDSNPRSRAHEAREDNRSSTAQSGWQESNLRSPAPEAGGVAFSPTARSEHRVPPAGFEPAASGLRARRHRRFDHGGMKLRRQGSNLPLTVNSRASCQLDHAGTNRRKERESNPQGPRAHPFSRRDTAPVAVLPSDSGRRRTCTVPGKNRELCRVELRSRDVTGRDRTCDAPRFRRALYRAELRSRGVGGVGVEPTTSSSSERRSAT